ncbi:unnamed protein product, partial [Rotaria socialis]
LLDHVRYHVTAIIGFLWAYVMNSNTDHSKGTW